MSQDDTATHLRLARRLIRVYAHTPDNDTASDVADAFERCLGCPLKSLRLRCCLRREAKRWRALSDQCDVGHDTPQADSTPPPPSALH
ncbi:MAG: hypothetical protein AAF460_00040 [Pseudomonadota bacterium]